MLAECLISLCGLYECLMCGFFAYDIIRNEYNCCKKEDEYVVIERNSPIIPSDEIDVETLFAGYPKSENVIIDQRIS